MTLSLGVDSQDDRDESLRKIQDDDDSSLEKKSHHQEIKEIALRIKTSVKQLYRPKKSDEDKEKRRRKAQESAPSTPKERKTEARPTVAEERQPIKSIKKEKKPIQTDKPQDESDDENSDDDDVAPQPGAPRMPFRDEGSSSSSEGDIGHVMGFDGLADDYDPEDWDMVVSRNNVNRLVNNLKASKRTECMTKLNTWFSAKAKEIQEGPDVLTEYENECESDAANFYVGNWSAGKNIDRNIEEKEIRSIRTLNKFYKSLRSHVKTKRHKFAKATTRGFNEQPQGAQVPHRKSKGNHNMEDSDFEDDDDTGDDNRFLGPMNAGVKALRERLLDKEREIREMISEGENCIAEGGPDTALTDVTTDLLEIISMQQNDLADLQTESDLSAKELQTAKQAAEFLSIQQVQGEIAAGKPDEGVFALLTKMEGNIRNEKMGLANQSAEDEKLKEEEDEEAIQREVSRLRRTVDEVQDEIKQLKETGIYDHLVVASAHQLVLDTTGGATSPVPDRELAASPTSGGLAADGKGSDGNQTSQERQLAKDKATEIEKMKEDIEKYDKLLPQAERALGVLEGYRLAFTKADQESNAVWHELEELRGQAPAAATDGNSKAPASDLMSLAGQIEDGERKAEDEERRKNMLNNENMLKQEHDRLEKNLEMKKKRMQEESQKQDDMKANIENLKEKIKELSKESEGAMPSGVDACNNEVTKLQAENARLDAKVMELNQQIIDETRRLELEQEAAGGNEEGDEDENAEHAVEEPEEGLEENDEADLEEGHFEANADEEISASPPPPPITLASNPSARLQDERRASQQQAQAEQDDASSKQTPAEQESAQSTASKAQKPEASSNKAPASNAAQKPEAASSKAPVSDTEVASGKKTRETNSTRQRSQP